MPIKAEGDAARALEAMLVRQLLETSGAGAFKSSGMAGASVYSGMFTEALADAITKGGGLGIAKMIERSLGAGALRDEDAEASTPTLSIPARPIGILPPPADPTAGKTTSGFGPRAHPIDGAASFHTGVDLRGAEGTPIQAAAAGVVARAGARGGYGNAVEVAHEGGLSTLYAHAASLTVQPGEKVEKGQVIGYVGQTGRATGPHLHFETRVDGRPIDPARALKAYGVMPQEAVGAIGAIGAKTTAGP